MKHKNIICGSLALMLLLSMTACNIQSFPEETIDPASAINIEEEMVALNDAPAVFVDYTIPSGKATKSNNKATVDYSDIKDGYVMVKWIAKTDKRIKVRISGPTTDYTYNLSKNEWTTFSLTDGNGDYTVKVFQQTTGTKYAVALSQSFSVTFNDEYAPFLKSNQYVNFINSTETKNKAAELCKSADTLSKVEAVYTWVVDNISYDKELAKTVQSGYLPVLDDVLAKRKGICFDYAALMTGMLRSQGVPCKLVVGYAGAAYHAWISVYVDGKGWIDGAVYFDGTSWQRMDPTFASSGNKSEAIMKYIGDGQNYTEKYFY